MYWAQTFSVSCTEIVSWIGARSVASSLKCLFAKINSIVRVMGSSVKVNASWLRRPPKVERVKRFSTFSVAFVHHRSVVLKVVDVVDIDPGGQLDHPRV